MNHGRASRTCKVYATRCLFGGSGSASMLRKFGYPCPTANKRMSKATTTHKSMEKTRHISHAESKKEIRKAATTSSSDEESRSSVTSKTTSKEKSKEKTHHISHVESKKEIRKAATTSSSDEESRSSVTSKTTSKEKTRHISHAESKKEIRKAATTSSSDEESRSSVTSKTTSKEKTRHISYAESKKEIRKAATTSSSDKESRSSVTSKTTFKEKTHHISHAESKKEIRKAATTSSSDEESRSSVTSKTTFKEKTRHISHAESKKEIRKAATTSSSDEESRSNVTSKTTSKEKSKEKTHHISHVESKKEIRKAATTSSSDEESRSSVTSKTTSKEKTRHISHAESKKEIRKAATTSSSDEESRSSVTSKTTFKEKTHHISHAESKKEIRKAATTSSSDEESRSSVTSKTTFKEKTHHISHAESKKEIRKAATTSSSDEESRSSVTSKTTSKEKSKEKTHHISHAESKNEIRKAATTSSSDADSSDNSLDCEDQGIAGSEDNLSSSTHRGPPPRITVVGCNHTKTKFVFDKTDYCFYCTKNMLSTSLGRHLNSHHQFEEKVKEINVENKGSRKRKRLLQIVRNLGNFYHNQEVLKNGGQLVVVQRPKKTVDITHKSDIYAACSHCYGYYCISELWRHNCPALEEETPKVRKTKVVFNEDDDEELNVFFSRMSRDELTDIAKTDSLIRAFVSNEMIKRGMKKFKSTSEKARILCNFLKQYRIIMKKDSVDFETIFVPDELENMKKVIMEMYQYNTKVTQIDEPVSMDKPSAVKKLGLCLIQLAEILRFEFMKRAQIEKTTETGNLIELLNFEIRPMMANAGLALDSAHHGRPVELPEDKQVSKLKEYIQKTLNKKFRENRYRKIAESVLAYIILYNKRRPGEASRLTKKTWEERGKWKTFAEKDRKKLTTDEINLLESLELVYVKGKGNKFVPILFPKNSIKAVQWLSERTNGYLFQNRNRNPIRGTDAMANVVKRAKICKDNLQSTKFRKLAATTLQLEDFNEAEFRFICEHMGHTPEVHKRWYRMRDATVELIKVGKILDNDYSGEGNVNSEEGNGWTKEQTSYLRMRCAGAISANTILRKKECNQILDEMPNLLRGKTWNAIKDKVRNESRKLRRIEEFRN